MFKTHSVLSEVALRVLPLLAVVSLLFFAGLVRLEYQRQLQTNSTIAQLRTDNLSELLKEPLWQFSDLFITNILSSNLSQSTLCLLILDEQQRPTYNKGDCQQTGQWFDSDITYEISGRQRTIGRLRMLVNTQPQYDNIKHQALYLAMLTALLFATLSLTSYWVMRNVILRPLNRVADSLHRYRLQGQFQPVDWHSSNELGQFVALFNQSIDLQNRYQQELLGAKAKAESTLEDLRLTQAQLIHSEKMASLGSIVAGIAHEINTPIGNSLTVASTLTDKLSLFQASMLQGVKKSALDQFLRDAQEASDILLRSLNMAAEQVANFKQVAVDQTSEQKRPFDLASVIHDVLSTLRPSIKHKPICVELDLDEQLLMNSYPGPLGQVLSNCFNNSMLHGLGDRAGVIRIQARALAGQQTQLIIEDDGQGMTDDQLQRAMDPFFTTKLGQGGSGLGLHLVYQLIRNTLKGSIHLSSAPNQGFRVTVTLPNNPDQQDVGVDS